MKDPLALAAGRGIVTAIFVAMPLLLGSAPAGAGLPASPGGLAAPLSAPEASLVQRAHCRSFWHTHRRCVRWSGGVCRAWRTWRHRC